MERTFQSKMAGNTEGDFVNGQAEGQGKLTTEQEVVYEGTFKQGVFSKTVVSKLGDYFFKIRESSALEFDK